MKKLFIISSVIYPKNKSLSYSSVRSTFSEDERYQQTIETVQSIRRYAPDADILWIEAGTKNVYAEEFEKMGVLYRYIGKNYLVRGFVDSKFKGAGESIMLFIGTLGCSISQYSFLYKISGRYLLNNEFDQHSLQKKSRFSFLELKKHYSTRLYCFDKKLYFVWKLYLLAFVLFGLGNLSIELLWYYLLPKKMVFAVKQLGIQGKIGVNGDLIVE